MGPIVKHPVNGEKDDGVFFHFLEIRIIPPHHGAVIDKVELVQEIPCLLLRPAPADRLAIGPDLKNLLEEIRSTFQSPPAPDRM
jgi:hypothetical protein